MLEGILKGLLQWLYGLVLEIVEYIANGLLEVFSMDLAYFQQVAPVAEDIVNILIACGWALLLGNLVFQAAKTMISGLGFEGEDPRTLFARTFIFGFLLLASRQVCDMGLGLAGRIIELLGVPDSVSVSLPGESFFSIGASWLLVIIIGLVLMWQLVKLFFEIGERYFIVAFLTMMAPLAFATGGSKNTADIFKGWVRMYGSMCLMMTLNVVFLKLLLSAMGNMPSDVGVLPWMVLVVAIARVARKADDLIMRIGLNPAMTGSGLGTRLPGMLSAMVLRTAASSVIKSTSANGAGITGAAGSGKAPSGSTPPTRSGKVGNVQIGTSSHTAANMQHSRTSSESARTYAGSADNDGAVTVPGFTGNEQGVGGNTTSQNSSLTQTLRGSTAPPGIAGSRGRAQEAVTTGSNSTGQSGRPSGHAPPGINGTAGIKSQGSGDFPVKQSSPPPGMHGTRQSAAIPGMAGTKPQDFSGSISTQAHYSGAPPGLSGVKRNTETSGTAGMVSQISSAQSHATGTLTGKQETMHSAATLGTAGIKPQDAASTQSRYTNVPTGLNGTRRNAEASGTAGTSVQHTDTRSNRTEHHLHCSDTNAATQNTVTGKVQQGMSPSSKIPPNMQGTTGIVEKSARRTAAVSPERATTPSSPGSSPVSQEMRTSRSERASRETPQPIGTAGKSPTDSRSFGEKSQPGQRMHPTGIPGGTEPKGTKGNQNRKERRNHEQ